MSQDDWLRYRLKILDMLEKHEDEINRLHDIVLRLDIRKGTNLAVWGWVGGVAGSIVGSVLTAVVIHHFWP